MAIDQGGDYKIKENQYYLFANMETLKASDVEAFKDSLTENFVDGIESWWCGIPSDEKKRKKIWNLSYDKKISSIEAWIEAEAAYAPTEEELYPAMLKDDKRRKAEISLARKARALALRKKQIIIDTLNAMGFLLTKWEKSGFESEDVEDTDWQEMRDGK